MKRKFIAKLIITVTGYMKPRKAQREAFLFSN